MTTLGEFLLNPLLGTVGYGLITREARLVSLYVHQMEPSTTAPTGCSMIPLIKFIDSRSLNRWGKLK